MPRTASSTAAVALRVLLGFVLLLVGTRCEMCQRPLYGTAEDPKKDTLAPNSLRASRALHWEQAKKQTKHRYIGMVLRYQKVLTQETMGRQMRA
jgi:hypothetical protein